jgi:hypothetical protein
MRAPSRLPVAQRHFRSLEVNLATSSLTQSTTPAEFIRLLDLTLRATALQDCPTPILLDIQRLLCESFSLRQPLLRERFAIACRPLADRFTPGIFYALVSNAIENGNPSLPRIVEGVAWASIIFTPRELAKITLLVEKSPECATSVLPLLLFPGQPLSVFHWRAFTAAIAGQRHLLLTVFERVLATFQQGPSFPDSQVCALLCGAITRVAIQDWPPGRRQQVFNLLWPHALSPVMADWHLGLLARLCEILGDTSKFGELVSPRFFTQDRNPSLFHGISATACRLAQPYSLRRVFEIHVARVATDPSYDPFLQPEAWSPLITAAGKSGDITLTMEIFDYLARSFRPLRHSNWGPMAIPLRRLARSLPIAHSRKILDRLNHRNVDAAECLAEWRKGPFKNGIYLRRNQIKGEILFAGAARELMQWMINGFIGESIEVLRVRAETVVDGLLSVPESYRNDAIFHLFARGQGSYVGAINGQAMQNFQEQAHAWSALSDAEVAALFRNSDLIKFKIVELIAPERIAEPEYEPPEELKPTIRAIAALLIWSQRDLFRGVRREGTQWFDRLSPLVDRLTAALDEGNWNPDLLLLTLEWFIPKISSVMALMVGANASVHDFLNEFRDRWRPHMQSTQHNPLAARTVMHDFLARISEVLASTTGVHTGPRSLIRAGGVLIHGCIDLTRLPILEENYSYRLPQSQRLWLMDGQLEDSLAPLIIELRRNAEKSLRILDRHEDRLYRFEISKEDDQWLRLSVKNSYDPLRKDELPSSGFGARIINNICRRLRSPAGAQRAPEWNIYPFVGHDRLRIYERIVFLPCAADAAAGDGDSSSEEVDDGPK